MTCLRWVGAGVALFICALGWAAHAGSTVCTQAGPITGCSDGTVSHTFAGRTTDNRGLTWLHQRELTIGGDGRVYQRPPGKSYDPSPFALPHLGTGPLGSQPGAVPGNVLGRGRATFGATAPGPGSR